MESRSPRGMLVLDHWCFSAFLSWCANSQFSPQRGPIQAGPNDKCGWHLVIRDGGVVLWGD